MSPIVRILPGLVLTIFACPVAMYAQANDGPYQVGYLSNVSLDAAITVVNDGFTSGGSTPIADQNSYGNFCVNVYVYAANQRLATCCSCLVSPNSLHYWTVFSPPGGLLQKGGDALALASINATDSVVIKLLGTNSNSAGASPNDSCPSPVAPTAIIPAGLLAWTIDAHTLRGSQPAIAKTRFEPGNLSAGELNKLTNDCRAVINAGQSLCPNCSLGAK